MSLRKNYDQSTSNQPFKCVNCGETVEVTGFIGTHNRNHCPFCLWSKHVDIKPGDRAAECGGSMEPLGLTLKNSNEGAGKGEIMLIHECTVCGKVNINRIAADDDPKTILKVFENSLLPDIQSISGKLSQQNIKLLSKTDTTEVTTQLFGNSKGGTTGSML